jgi:tetratricopeptide (TPR) repeat protein
VDAYLFHGVSYYQTDQYTRALASLKKFCSLKPEDPQIHFFLGAVYYELGDYSNAALQDLEQLRTGSDQDRTYYYLGKAYQALGDEALRTLRGRGEKDQKVLAEALKPRVLECQQTKGLADGLLLTAWLNVSEDLSAGTAALMEAQRHAPEDKAVTFWSFRLYSALAESAYAKIVA